MSLLEPYNEDADELITRPHRQSTYARANHPDWTAPLTLVVENADIVWDETTAPRVQATFTCRVPDNSADINLLDPRTGVRIEVFAGYIFPGGGEDVHQIADLGLRERRINRPANQMILRAYSDEALVVDNSPAIAVSATGSTTAAAMQALIYQAITPNPVVEITATGGQATTTVDPVTDRWSTIDDLADRINADVYDAGLRDWVIEDRNDSTGLPALSLKVGSNGTIITSDSSLNRDTWYNYVELDYKWTDLSGVDHEVIATAYITDTDFIPTGDAGYKKYLEERDTQTTQAEANKAAASILRRFMSRATEINLNAISAYWLRPGMTVSVQLREGTQKDYHASRVQFDLISGSMDVRLREPVPITIDTTTPVGGSVVGDPTPTATAVYKTTWITSDTASYQEDGGTPIFGDVGYLYQGSWNIDDGNQFALALFTGANSTGSEVGVTITDALAGASIRKVEVYLWNVTWFAGSGTARIGWYNGTTLPATASYSNVHVLRNVEGWKQNTGKWLDITGSINDQLLAGNCRAISVGRGLSSNEIWTGRFHGDTASAGSRRAQLRITYIK